MTITDAVRKLIPIQHQIADVEMLKALNLVCHTALMAELEDEFGKGPCEACFDGIYITDATKTYAGVEHPFCAECGRKLISDKPTE